MEVLHGPSPRQQSTSNVKVCFDSPQGAHSPPGHCRLQLLLTPTPRRVRRRRHPAASPWIPAPTGAPRCNSSALLGAWGASRTLYSATSSAASKATHTGPCAARAAPLWRAASGRQPPNMYYMCAQPSAMPPGTAFARCWSTGMNCAGLSCLDARHLKDAQQRKRRQQQPQQPSRAHNCPASLPSCSRCRYGNCKGG